MNNLTLRVAQVNSPISKSHLKDPQNNLAFIKRLIEYYKAQFLIGDDRTKFRRLAMQISTEYKNYCDKIFGLKNLEKSYPDFFTD